MWVGGGGGWEYEGGVRKKKEIKANEIKRENESRKRA